MDNDRYCPAHGRTLRYAATPKDQLLFDIARVLGAMDHYEDVRDAEAQGNPSPDEQGRSSGHVYDADVVFALNELKERYEAVLVGCSDDLGIESVKGVF